MKQLRVITGIVLMVLMMGVSVMAAEVFIPHLTGASTGWGDYLTIDNLSLAPATVTVTLYDDAGTSVYSGAHAVSGLGESVIDLKPLSSIAAQSGKVTYSGDSLHFRLSLLNITSGGVAEFRLDGSQGSVLGFFFSDFASVVAWKGLALANYGATSAAVTLYAIGGGQVLETVETSVLPYSKISGTHATWFPTLTMNEIKKIVAVSSVATLGGIAIASNAVSSKMLFTAAVPMEAFSVGEFTGTWRGEWVSNEPGYSGDVVMHLVQTGNLLTGDADIDDTDCGDVRGVPMTGTVVENVVIFTALYNCGGNIATLEFTQGSRRGDTISGTYQQNVNGQLYDLGTFWLTKE